MTKISDSSVNTAENSSDREYMKKYAKQILKKTLFVGTFTEKRFVESINEYRNVICIAGEEEKFIRDIFVVKKRLQEAWPNPPWIGITFPDAVGAPAGHNLWVDLPHAAFGKYWYKVKTVEFLEKEIRLKLEVIRPMKQECTPSKSQAEKSGQRFDINESVQDLSRSLRDNLIYFCREILTFSNIKDTVTFISLLIVTIVVGGIKMIKYLLEYILKLLKEINGLIKTITPIIVHLLNVISKLVFGLYHMIVMLFQGKPKAQPVYNAYFNVDPQLMPANPNERYNKYFDRAIPYYPNSRKITPLDD